MIVKKEIFELQHKEVDLTLYRMWVLISSDMIPEEIGQVFTYGMPSSVKYPVGTRYIRTFEIPK